jgi:polar amino acid transport system substrate-binding protein
VRPHVRALVIVALLVGATGATACHRAAESGSGDGPTLAEIKQRGEILWGGDVQGGEPYIYEDPKDPHHLIGFEVDIMDALARRLGVRSHMVQTTWPVLVPSLERGDFDVVMNGLEATSDRQERLLLSRPYFVYAETLAVAKGAPYRSLEDLRGKRVGTLAQTYAFELLRAKDVELRVYEGDEEPYLDLAHGRLDGVLLDNLVADRYGCPMEGVQCLPGDVARGVYVIGMRRGDNALKKAIDQALGAMLADGELEQILRKWNLWDERQKATVPAVSASPEVDRAFDLTQLRLFVSAAGVTLGVSLAAFLLAVPVGLLLAISRVYGGPVARGAARVYIEVFRGTPVLLQLYVLYYGLAPYWNLGPLEAAILGLGLNYGAYEAEVYRGALLAIPRGQSEAAKALGLGPWQTLRHVLLPQALRLALPAMTNDFVSMLKDSSLVSAITVIELTKRMTIAAVDLRGWLVPGLACAALYMALSFPLSELARRLERRLARDQRPFAL